MTTNTTPTNASAATTAQRFIVLDIEAGNLPQWSEQEAQRLSKLATFQPFGWTAVGSSMVYKKLNAALRAAGVHGQWRETVARDICDMARLITGAK